MDLQIEKLQKDITGLLESSREIQNSGDIRMFKEHTNTFYFKAHK